MSAAHDDDTEPTVRNSAVPSYTRPPRPDSLQSIKENPGYEG
jgi:hypothetical protein